MLVPLARLAMRALLTTTSRPVPESAIVAEADVEEEGGGQVAIRRSGASSEPAAVERARPNSYAGVWVFGSGAFLTAGVSSAGLQGSRAPMSVVVSVALMSFAALLALMTLYLAVVYLEWSGSRIAVVAGPWRRQVSLASLTELGYARSGRTALYLLRDSRGGRLKLQAGQFLRDDVWKALVLSAARRQGARIDPRAATSLSHADGTGRVYLA